VRSLHTYDTPEIIAVPVAHVSAPYFEWITSNAFPPLVSRQAVEGAAASAAEEGQ